MKRESEFVCARVRVRKAVVTPEESAAAVTPEVGLVFALGHLLQQGTQLMGNGVEVPQTTSP